MIVIAEDAYFSVAYVKIGLSPDGGATALLAQAMPRQLMTEMCLIGNKVDAVRLLQAGMVNRIVPTGSVLEEALMIASQTDPESIEGISAFLEKRRANYGKLRRQE